MKTAHLFTLIAALLSGCASIQPSQLGMNLMNGGNNQAAYNVFMQCANQGDPYCINNIGVMYEQGRIGGYQQVENAVAQYALAARYGLPAAQQNLVRLGREVPPADLQVSHQAQMLQQQQIAARNEQLAEQLGYAAGCALAGGCGQQPSQPRQSFQSTMPQQTRTAYWTGKRVSVQTVTYQQGLNCEYRYNLQIFWKVFTGSCPSSIQIQ